MQKMFHEKFMTITKFQLVAETKIVIVNANVVDVNVTTRSKVIEEHLFKDKKSNKNKKCC